MKTWMFRSLLVSLLFTTSVFSQEIQRVQLKKELPENAYFPSLAGYFEGKIPIEHLGDSVGITNLVGWKVLSFDLSYAFGREQKLIHISGSSIPIENCLEIRKNTLGEYIFFTNIKAMDHSGRIVFLIPMSLIPILID